MPWDFGLKFEGDAFFEHGDSVDSRVGRGCCGDEFQRHSGGSILEDERFVVVFVFAEVLGDVLVIFYLVRKRHSTFAPPPAV